MWTFYPNKYLASVPAALVASVHREVPDQEKLLCFDTLKFLELGGIPVEVSEIQTL